MTKKKLEAHLNILEDRVFALEYKLSIMNKKKKIKPKTLAIKRLYRQGLTPKNIALQTGYSIIISLAVVYYHLKK